MNKVKQFKITCMKIAVYERNNSDLINAKEL